MNSALLAFSLLLLVVILAVILEYSSSFTRSHFLFTFARLILLGLVQGCQNARTGFLPLKPNTSFHGASSSQVLSNLETCHLRNFSSSPFFSFFIFFKFPRFSNIHQQCLSNRAQRKSSPGPSPSQSISSSKFSM